jgi:DNA end-binding protein Ku
MAALQASVEEARKRRASQPNAAPSSGGGARRARRTSNQPDDLSKATKAELAQRASKLDIAGRSKMSKDELEEAIREAESDRTRRRAS